jgi:hypothetical protein
MRHTQALAVLSVLTAAMVAVVPASSALVGGWALVVNDPASGKRCYVYQGEDAFELWVETNGVMSGGVPTPTGTSSGLQRTGSLAVRPDTEISNFASWAQRCRGPAVLPGADDLYPCDAFPRCLIPRVPTECVSDIEGCTGLDVEVEL